MQKSRTLVSFKPSCHLEQTRVPANLNAENMGWSFLIQIKADLGQIFHLGKQVKEALA
jgi:hypothetical protein